MSPPVRPGPLLSPWGAAGGVDLGPHRRNLSPGGAWIRATPGAAMGVELPSWARLIYSLQDFCFFNGTVVIPVSTVSIKVLDAPVNWRNALILRNSSPNATDIIFVNFGAPASTASIVRLPMDESWMWDIRTPQDELFAICTTTTGVLSIAQSQFTPPLGPGDPVAAP